MHPDTEEIVVTPLRLEQIPIVIDLARQIWYPHYAQIISTEQIDYMLATRYSEESILNGIQKGEQYFLATANEEAVGYASMLVIDHVVWLNKLYVLPSCHGKGVGRQLLKVVLKQAGDNACIKLQVNRQNIKAINFYFRNGFVIEHAADFGIGNGFYMNDFVMVNKSRV